MTEFRYSATAEQIRNVANLPADMAEAWSRQLAETHTDEVAYYPSQGEGIDVSRISRELGIELTAERVSGQAHILAPTALGGYALWRQRPGTVYRPGSGQILYKSERLA